jgi:hypothetical protein
VSFNEDMKTLALNAY